MNLKDRVRAFLNEKDISARNRNVGKDTISQLLHEFSVKEKLRYDSIKYNQKVRTDDSKLNLLLNIVCDFNENKVKLCKSLSREREIVYLKVGYVYLVLKHYRNKYSSREISNLINKNRSIITYYSNKLEGRYYQDIKDHADQMYNKHTQNEETNTNNLDSNVSA